MEGCLYFVPCSGPVPLLNEEFKLTHPPQKVGFGRWREEYSHY